MAQEDKLNKVYVSLEDLADDIKRLRRENDRLENENEKLGDMVEHMRQTISDLKAKNAKLAYDYDKRNNMRGREFTL
jgi:regulator of replication initiation timing